MFRDYHQKSTHGSLRYKTKATYPCAAIKPAPLYHGLMFWFM
jgi:hypothetical protein